MEEIKSFKTQLFISACLNLGSMVLGSSVVWSSPVTPKLQNLNETILPQIISLKDASWIASCFQLGVSIGPLVAGYLSNCIGRKKSMMIASITMTFSHVMMLFATRFAVVTVARLLTGIGGGMIIILNVIYIGEMSSTSIRGIILTSTGISYSFGGLLINSVGPFLSIRGITSILMSLAAIHLAGIMYIPESPIFHLIKGRESDAVTILNYLGRAKDVEDFKALQKLTTENQNEDWKFSELFTIKSNRKSLIITLFAFGFQQFGGMLAALYFTTSIFEIAKSSIDPGYATIVTSVTQFVGTLLVPSLVEKVGRKFLMMVSTAGCCFSLTTLGTYFYFYETKHPAIDTIGWLPLVSLTFLFFLYSIGLNIIPNTLVGELFRPNVRSIGSSLACTSALLLGFLNITSFGYAIELLGNSVVFWVFAVINAIGFLFSVIYIPETKGLSLSEIQQKLER